MNVNSKKNYSIILSVTYHCLRNFAPLIHIPHIHLWIFKSYELLFLEFWSFIKCLMWIGKNLLNNFICHWSFFKKPSPTYTHPLISICEFSKTYELLFFKFKSFVKCWMWIEKNSLHNFICHLSFFMKPSPLIHIPLIHS